MKNINLKIEEVSQKTLHGVQLLVEPLVGGYAVCLRSDLDESVIVLNNPVTVEYQVYSYGHWFTRTREDEVEAEGFGKTLEEALADLDAKIAKDYIEEEV